MIHLTLILSAPNARLVLCWNNTSIFQASGCTTFSNKFCSTPYPLYFTDKFCNTFLRAAPPPPHSKRKKRYSPLPPSCHGLAAYRFAYFHFCHCRLLLVPSFTFIRQYAQLKRWMETPRFMKSLANLTITGPSQNDISSSKRLHKSCQISCMILAHFFFASNSCPFTLLHLPGYSVWSGKCLLVATLIHFVLYVPEFDCLPLDL